MVQMSPLIHHPSSEPKKAAVIGRFIGRRSGPGLDVLRWCDSRIGWQGCAPCSWLTDQKNNGYKKSIYIYIHVYIYIYIHIYIYTYIYIYIYGGGSKPIILSVSVGWTAIYQPYPLWLGVHGTVPGQFSRFATLYSLVSLKYPLVN